MSVATCTPFTLSQGPPPMRSLAFTGGRPDSAAALRYARHIRLREPTAFASFWQCASAPARPPIAPPSPAWWLVTKKLMFSPARGELQPATAVATNTPAARTTSFIPIELRHQDIGEVPFPVSRGGVRLWRTWNVSVNWNDDSSRKNTCAEGALRGEPSMRLGVARRGSRSEAGQRKR